MHWDVVEGKVDYCRFVRFKDGLNGRVQLDPREFTGLLSPLADVEFFNASTSTAEPLRGAAT
jgi:hypothetical protein